MTENVVTSDSFEQYLISHPFSGKPENLYNAMNYIMQLGGKRVRPKLLILAYQCVNGNLHDDVYKLALAIETFHNFSLVHDDIMDNASIRRGKKTVHEEWSQATAILAGDNMVVKCYDLILNSGLPNKLELLNEFTTMAIQVCEGQQFDMNLPTQEFISEDEYLQMIKLKTAVLPACALKMGALAAEADSTLASHFYNFGLSLGMAFQLQDDYLDAFGSELEIGKKEGGDILENKRTILYLHAMENLSTSRKAELNKWYSERVLDRDMKVKMVRELFIEAGSDTYLLQLKTQYEKQALEHLEFSCGNSEYKNHVMSLFDFLKARRT